MFTYNFQRRITTYLFLLILMVASIDTQAFNRDNDNDHDHDRDGRGGEHWHHHHHHHHHGGVIVNPHTHVASAELRQSMTAFDTTSGLMRFKAIPEALRLHKDDILVSEPSAAAPFGYLRRVIGVGRDSQGVWVSTTPAKLNDAIIEAHVTATVTLPTDGSHKAVLTSTQSDASVDESVLMPAETVGIGSSHSIDVDYHDNDIDLHVHGYENTWAGVTVGVDIDATCWFDGDPCFSFDSEAAERFDGAIRVNGLFHTHYTKDFDLVDETYDPITFFIGPVPVVLVPSLSINLNFDATANGSFDYAAQANAPEYRMSVHWDSDSGFSNGISSKPAHLDPGTINLTADVDAHATLPTEVKLRLYDVAGVNAIITTELDGKLHIPGKPRWAVSGELKGEVGVDASLPIIGDLGSSEATLFDEHFTIKESENSPPRVSIQSPVNGQKITLDGPDFGQVNLLANVSDDEDGSGCCAVAWKLAGTLAPLWYGNNIPATLSAVGHYDFIAIVTDSDHASVESASVGIDVSMSAPNPHIELPSAACASKLYVNMPVRLLGRDGTFFGKGYSSYTCLWIDGNAADASQFPIQQHVSSQNLSDPGCELEVIFPTVDTRMLFLEMTPDVVGGTSSFATRDFYVRDAPAGSIPLLRKPGPASCAEVAIDAGAGKPTTTTAYVELRNTTQGAHVTWSWQAANCAAVTMPVHIVLPSVCTPDYCPTGYEIVASELESVTPTACAVPTIGNIVGTATATATDAKGQSNSTQFYIRLSHSVSPR